MIPLLEGRQGQVTGLCRRHQVVRLAVSGPAAAGGFDIPQACRRIIRLTGGKTVTDYEADELLRSALVAPASARTLRPALAGPPRDARAPCASVRRDPRTCPSGPRATRCNLPPPRG